ncbi:alpha/beta fold hydrolase [Rhodobaculum claviforme]|uniref:Alpha/beta hydrolase n=1 Tax=Rhodobaculum claviforme TaxID=1549854 RepID=A0A934TNT2_9RHOB|nr:alpha/beta fold hydrolase [Rhodobaculum claviforme]MBK5928473.1 alpha/beta hydrolase [Rhodobaculum claviforme]
MLHALRHGAATDRPTVLIAHGLFGSARNWGAIARALATDRAVIAVDMRNHGDSPRDDRHGYADMARDLAEVAGDGPLDVIGHSMGGKAAMRLALDHPERVRRLAVIDIAPVAYGHTQQGLIDAMRALDLSDLRTRSEADRRLAAHVDDPGVRAFLLQSLDLRADPPRWRINLDALEANMAAILGWDGQGRFDGPALFLAGGASDYVRPDHRAPIRALFPAARIARIPGAGHWLHADRPEATAETLRAFLDG